MGPVARSYDYEGIPVLFLSDELDFSLKDELNAALGEFAGMGDFLLLDLRDVTFVDSTPLGLFIGLHAQLASRKGALAIASLQPYVRRVFELSGLLAQLNVFDRFDDAWAFLSRRSKPDAL